MTESPATTMADAASALLRSLDDDQAERVTFEADDDSERGDWAFYPREMAGETASGLALYDLTRSQKRLVHQLAAVGLSLRAYAQVNAIMALEHVLGAREGHARGDIRDPERYWVSIFGDPGPEGVWGWRFEGHHVSIHHTIIEGEVAASTPLFLGANPARVPATGRTVTRPCSLEEDVGRELVKSLNSDQFDTALLHDGAPIDVVVPNVATVPEVAIPGDPPARLAIFQEVFEQMTATHREALTIRLDAPRGIPANDLNTTQRRVFDDLLDIYVSRLPSALAERERARVDGDAVHFGWAGSTEVYEPHYYRLHGPTLLVEYDCVQNDGNHVHAVWRDPQRDFAVDPLRIHRAALAHG